MLGSAEHKTKDNIRDIIAGISHSRSARYYAGGLAASIIVALLLFTALHQGNSSPSLIGDWQGTLDNHNDPYLVTLGGTMNFLDGSNMSAGHSALTYSLIDARHLKLITLFGPRILDLSFKDANHMTLSDNGVSQNMVRVVNSVYPVPQ